MNSTNPGGSLGDFITPKFKNLGELQNFLKFHAGDLYSNYFAFLPLLSNKIVADLGCGYGYMTTAISGYTERIDGFDVDSNAVTFAQELSLLAEKKCKLLSF